MKNIKLNTIIKVIFISFLVFTVLYFVTFFLGSKNKVKEIDLQTVNLVQKDAVNGDIEDDAPIAVIKTSLGEIRAVLYPQYAPNTVKHFVDRAKKGLYNNTYIFRVEPNFWFYGGGLDKNGALEDGYDKDAEMIEKEIHQDLWPFKGAFCSYGTNKKSAFGGDNIFGGSRFIVLNSIEFTEDVQKQLIGSNEENEITKFFIEKGGVPGFSQQATIFAQTYQGFDVIEKITKLELEEEVNAPKGDVLVEAVEISTYGEYDK